MRDEVSADPGKAATPFARVPMTAAVINAPGAGRRPTAARPGPPPPLYCFKAIVWTDDGHVLRYVEYPAATLSDARAKYKAQYGKIPPKTRFTKYLAV